MILINAKNKNKQYIKERDSALNAKHSVDVEIEMIREKYTASLTQWESKINELDDCKRKCGAHEVNIQKYHTEILAHQNAHSTLLGEIALAMSNEFVKVEPNSKEIIEKIQILMSISKSTGLVS